MEEQQNKALKVSQKLDLLTTLFNRKPIRSVLEGFTKNQLVEAHQFLWDKLIEIRFLTQNQEFRREEVTKNMMSSAAYQRQQGCDLRLDYCKGVECIWSNPICAGNKVKNNMEVMGKTILKYLDSCRSKNNKVQAPRKQEEVNLWLEN